MSNYKLIRELNEVSVEVEAKASQIKCIDMQCIKCPFFNDYKVCMKVQKEDYLIEAKEYIEELKAKAENGYEVKHYNSLLKKLDEKIAFSMNKAQYQGANWKYVDFKDTCTHYDKQGNKIVNNEGDNENE